MLPAFRGLTVLEFLTDFRYAFRHLRRNTGQQIVVRNPEKLTVKHADERALRYE